MLSLFLIFAICGIFLVTLTTDFVAGIAAWDFKTNPKWISTAIKIILTVIVVAMIVVGTLCVGIVLVACSTGNKK